MKAKIYPSVAIINSNIEPCYLMAHYFLLASLVSKENITISNLKLNDYLIDTIKALEKLGIKVTFFGVDSCYVSNLPKEKKDIIEIDLINNSTLKYLFPLSLNLSKKVIFKTNSNFDLSCYDYIIKNCNVFIKKEENKITCSGLISIDYLSLNNDLPLIIGFILNSLYLKQALTIKVNQIETIKNSLLLLIDVFKKCGYIITIDGDYIYIHNEQTRIWDDFVIEGDYEFASYLIAISTLNGSFKSTYLKENSLQECYEIIPIIKKMGGLIKFIDDNKKYLYSYNNSLLEKGVAKRLKGITIEHINDKLLYLVMTIASFSFGKTIIKNTLPNPFINILKNLDVNIKYENNSIIIIGSFTYKNTKTINCLNDINIAKSLIVFSLLNNGCLVLENIPEKVKEFIEILKSSTKEHAITLYTN